ncbi:chitin deacetylase [Puccinia graminis f. sp. tritici]|uniref:chitin deacetylase n=2 Tax=Puccinia graminis f. sp. tritici TaxID=56615 RepID=E3L6V9_PUCGT|nr:chitin deacetylase [Puccinia graminis f. sp. tritici CRL 75-36-700-3]EFP92284.1 chitin deacetylase [Puccinia graminis f. sp. tritici CRL 75-36-700-3]KAA1116054.1 chitin deacetylase [Puccinia graminis f. sp. tritici]
MVSSDSKAAAVAFNRRITSKLILVTLCSSFVTSTAAHESHEFWGRQAPAAPVASAAAALPTTMPVPTPVTSSPGDLQTLNYPPIMKSMAPSTMTALPATYTAGTASPIRGAPPLPSTNLNVALYPALDRLPPLDSPLVKEWMSKIDWSKAPTSNPTGLGGCMNATNADAVAKSGKDENCWWTCGGCTRPTDIVSCPDKATWGASFDDGPSPDTPTLLNYLDQQKLKTTFFVVGSRVLSRPAMLQYEYQSGHQISVHTWSHPYLTTLSNVEIVAELGWSKKVIKDVLGVTPNTMRPPYGDIDDRVRFIAMSMGLTPIIWTTAPSGQTFDTQDWKISTGIVTPAQVLKNFQSIIAGAPDLPQGFIVLAHDLYPQSVALAVEFVLPAAIAAGNLTIEPIITCLGKPLSEGYIETANGGNASSSPTSRRETSQTSVNAPSKAANAAKPSISISSQNTRDLVIFVSAAALAILNVY